MNALFQTLYVLDLESPFVSSLLFLFLADISYLFIYREQIFLYITEHGYNSYFTNPCLLIPTSGSNWIQPPYTVFSFENGSHFPISLHFE